MPAEAEIVSHRLMLRAGLIRRLAAGIYTWLPLGLRVHAQGRGDRARGDEPRRRDRAGRCRWCSRRSCGRNRGAGSAYGPELLRFKDRHERDFVIQPTSEEVITDLARAELKSYRRLPVHFYQIQTKFRDERRPRFGIMRGREFVMKDGYSFHASYEDLQREYRNMYDTYTRIFTRLGLQVPRGGRRPRRDRRHRLAGIPRARRLGRGRDRVLPAVGLRRQRRARRGDGAGTRGAPKEEMKKVATPGKKTCEDVAALLKIDLKKTVKAVAGACTTTSFTCCWCAATTR